jgi:thiol-disulfide isomerase/thioredoxin
MLIELTTDTLKNEIDQHGKVLVQFSAGWCGNCRIMKPKFKKMASENTNMKFFMIDAEKILNQENLLT